MATATANSVILPTVNGSNGTLTDEAINGLVQGGSWQFGGGPRTLTYSFNINDAHDAFGNLIPGPGGTWTAALVDAVTRALGEWSKVANINFQNISSGIYYFQSNADLALTLTGNDLQAASGAVGLGVLPDPAHAAEVRDSAGFTAAEYPNPAGDVFLDNFYQAFQFLSAGGEGYSIVLHEIGHALGLKHPHDSGGNNRPTFEQLGMAANDSARWTVMSYNENANSSQSSGNDASPMPLDILAIQQIYGANMAYHTGDDTYSFVQNFSGAYSTIWDAGGIDTLDASSFFAFGGGVSIDLRPGVGFATSVQGNYGLLAIAYNVDIENAFGGGAGDIIFGNALDNVIDGRGGPDIMAGREGNDTYYVGDAGDSVVENPGEGIDTVIVNSSDFLLPANVENLTLTAFGARGTGDARNNVLTSLGGEQTLRGGAGDDTYVVTASPAPTFLTFSGDSGDYISGGQSYYFDPGKGAFSISATDSFLDPDTLVDTISVSLSAPNNGGSSFWNLDISTRYTGQQLVPGVYTGAVRFPFDNIGHPGLNLSGDGRGSNTLTGSFTVNAARFDYSGSSPQVLEFSVSFEQHSEGAVPALRGVLNINHPGSPGNIVELSNEGIDTVQSAISFVLPDNVENLSLTSVENSFGSGNGLDNLLTGNNGNNSLDGKAGIDSAIYTGAFRLYILSGNPTVSAALSGPEGNDTLISIETLKFLDGLKSYDAASHIWQVQRLYGSAFDRNADVLGLNFHSARLDAGTSLNDVAQDFVGSAEFLATYGSLNNNEFVNQLYLNVLNRPADAGGLAYWTGLLNSGSTRGAVLLGFSESPENIGNYAGQLAGGLWDIDESAASVARLYHGALDRAPDTGGLAYWTGQLKSGAQTLQQEAAGFVNSTEFQAHYGALNNSQFVNQLYLNVLDRPGDSGGLAYWTGLLNSGTSRADVTLGFTESFEFQVNMLGQIDDGIVVI